MNAKTAKKIPLFCALIPLLFCSCTEKKQLRVGVLNGPSAIPCAWMIENSGTSGMENLVFESCTSAQTELPKLLKGELDAGFLPPNVAAKVFNSGGGALVCLGICGNGNLYLLSKDHTPEDFSLEQLRGKTVQCAGQGATPQYMFGWLLEQAGLKDSVTMDFSIPNANIAAALVSGKVQYALVPEPFATVAQTKDSSVKRVLNIQEEYKKITSRDFPMTVLVANACFARENKKLLKKFTEFYARANHWTVKNPKEAGVLTEKANLGLTAFVAEKAVSNANFVWQAAPEGREQIESLLSLFLKAEPKSIGGKLPDDGFYFSVK